MSIDIDYLNSQYSHKKIEKSLRQAIDDVSTVLPLDDPFYPSDNRCRRCAVVGSSYNLIKSRYDSLIDSKEIVIR